ncbi:abscisic acid receptor PYL4-like [Silene latifolia]|uniref:abscisic acid receptor PYL4-like n=1 Tax=Silene latifolia TaxID=37657 RepID=UPI003D770538
MSPTIQLRAYTTTTTTATTYITNTSPSVIETMAAEIIPSLAHDLTRELSRSHPSLDRQMEIIARYHNHEVGPNQCASVVVKHIAAPTQSVWSLVKRFDQPQTYKRFLRSCRLIAGDGAQVGSLREVHCVSGIPAASSTERLEVLDEESHAIGFRIVGGEHRLHNYRSITTVHPSYPSAGSEEGTVVVESYVVDVPQGNNKQETCVFVDTIVRCNLQSLASLTERMGRSSSTLSSVSTNSSSSSVVTSSSSCKVS